MLSVVIPTRDRETRLAFALEALASQGLSEDELEVIVIRDSGAPGPRATPPLGLGVTELVAGGAPPPPAPALKRNLGWRQARARLVAFLDDDCRPAEGWARALIDSAGDECVLQGATRPDPDESHDLHPLARSLEVEPPSGWFETCNIAYPRGILDRLGGFDESLGWFGDDTDLGRRAMRAGFELRAVPGALAFHAVFHRGPAQALRDQFRRGGTAMLVSRYPELRELLMSGVFTDAAHPSLLAGLAGVAASRRWPLASVLALPYVKRNFGADRLLDPWGLARAPAQLASRAAVDAAGVAAGLRASVRHRALVI